jgi:prepilin-type N-terminal cleavage/methylation domain-containing protein
MRRVHVSLGFAVSPYGSYTPQVKTRAFTLIEMLVVVTIITVLMGLMMPVLTIMRRFAKTSSTQAVMKKTDTALRLFHTDWQVYPGQMRYADLENAYLRDQLMLEILLDIRDLFAVAPAATKSSASALETLEKLRRLAK